MHQPIRDKLEGVLSGRLTPNEAREVQPHLAGCGECRTEVDVMQSHAAMLRLLRAEEEFEPAAGFYARVLDRIEAERASTFWAAFLLPAEGRRLAYAALALLVTLGVTALSTGGGLEPHGLGPAALLVSYEYPPTPGIDLLRDHSVVLTSVASYQDEMDGLEPPPLAVPAASEEPPLRLVTQ